MGSFVEGFSAFESVSVDVGEDAEVEGVHELGQAYESAQKCGQIVAFFACRLEGCEPEVRIGPLQFVRHGVEAFRAEDQREAAVQFVDEVPHFVSCPVRLARAHQAVVLESLFY